MDLHPYDNKERRYRDTDLEPREGLQLVARVLRLSEVPAKVDRLLFDLSFYSGGVGVIDQLAITMPIDAVTLRAVTADLDCKAPEEAIKDQGWKDEFLWLISDADNSLPICEEAARFINQNRRAFQPECRPSDSIWFLRAKRRESQ